LKTRLAFHLSGLGWIGGLSIKLHRRSIRDTSEEVYFLCPFHCPACGSLIYGRRNVLCGRCGVELPKDLLFTAKERKKVDADLAELRIHRRAQLKAEPQQGGVEDAML